MKFGIIILKVSHVQKNSPYHLAFFKFQFKKKNMKL